MKEDNKSELANIFKLPTPLPDSNEEELFEELLANPNLKIERIVSNGQTTPEGKWYEQATAEWVVLLQGNAELTYENGEQTQLKAGDYLLIPAMKKHRVSYTSTEPPCIWLAIHFTSEGGVEG